MASSANSNESLSNSEPIDRMDLNQTKTNNDKKMNSDDDMDSWFNDLDDKMVEIINNNLIKEEDEGDDLDKFPPAICENDEPLETTEFIYIEDILNKNPEQLTSNETIQYECSIAYFIQVLIEGSNLNKIKSLKNHDNNLTFEKIADIITYLKWISNACKILSKRINQELLVYQYDDKPFIVRSSYNFCTKYTQCKNFYSKHEIPSCKEHHYVHSLLKYDIDSVISFLQYIIDNTISVNKEEFNNIYLSIKTICFVTRHMAKEISYIDYITKNNSETFHRNNPIDFGRKKNIVKRSWNNEDNYQNDYIKHVPQQRVWEPPQYRPNRYPKRMYNTIPRYRSNTNSDFKKTSLMAQNKPSEQTPNRYSILSELGR